MSPSSSLAAQRVFRVASRLFPIALFAITLGAPAVYAQSLPSGWTSGDVGAPVVAGRATHSNGIFTLEGAGADIYDRADQFQFLRQQVTGDVTIVARLDSLEVTDPYAKAGVMIRESLSPGSRYAAAIVSAQRGIGFLLRSTTDGYTRATVVSGAAPVWLKVERRGSTVTVSQSSNGTSWTQVGSTSISMASQAYVGLVVTSHYPSTLATAVFSNVTVSGTSNPLPTTWNSADVGSPSTAGATTATSASSFSVSGAGVDIWGNSDQFRYVYQQVSGDVDVITRVATFQSQHTWSKAGVMIRASMSADSAHAFALVSGSQGVAFQRRPAAGVASVHSSGGSGAAPVWLKLERRGSAVTSFRSSNGTSWTMIDSQTLTLPTRFYVGLAVTSHRASRTATASFTNVSVGTASAPTPPTVSLTAPAADATFTAPASVTISATASDADNGVASVEFYANGNLVGTDSTNPYSYSWSNVAAGNYSLTAVARDTAGAVTTSGARNITVSATTSNQPPTVALTAPAAGSTYTAPASMTVSANASDTDGGVMRVEFYAGSALIGSDATSPYSIPFSNVSAGSYTLTAIAYDTSGAQTTSAARTITVNGVPANQPPTVGLTAPAAGSTYTAPASMTVSANAADGDGGVARVEFYANSALIGTDTSSPYSVAWSGVIAGSYSLTAVATDDRGARTTSAARTVEVATPQAPRQAVFGASPDHATVTRYSLDIFTAGADPTTATPMATQNLGKPAVTNGECNVDIAATISGLPSGSYFATVVAIGPGGTSPRAVSSTFSR